jgi:glycosyltransferase involved in cell wall biosynthesis
MHQRRKLIYLHRTRATGAERMHICGIVRAFERSGWSVTVLSPPGITLEEAATAGRTRGLSRFWARISDHIPQVFFEVLELAYNFRSLIQLLRAIHHDSIDLIYERHSLFNFAGTWIARRWSIPIVLEVNGCTVLRSRPLNAKWLARRIEAHVFRSASYIAIVSENYKRLLVERHRVPPDRVVVHPNAVDLTSFPSPLVDYKESNEPFTLGMVAAFIAWHGVEFLIDTVAEFLKRTGSILVLVGDGPGLLGIRETIRKHGLEEYVQLTGFVPSSKIRGLLARMDVCIMANSNEYGSPMKIFEYMACGKAVVAPAYGPIQEIITHGVNGLLFEPLKSDLLLERIQALYKDPRLRQRLGCAARQSIVSNHTWDHRVRALEAWLDGDHSGDRGAEMFRQLHAIAPATSRGSNVEGA